MRDLTAVKSNGIPSRAAKPKSSGTAVLPVNLVKKICFDRGQTEHSPVRTWSQQFPALLNPAARASPSDPNTSRLRSATRPYDGQFGRW